MTYKSEAGRDILAEPTLLFASGSERSVLAARGAGAVKSEVRNG